MKAGEPVFHWGGKSEVNGGNARMLKPASQPLSAPRLFNSILGGAPFRAGDCSWAPKKDDGMKGGREMREGQKREWQLKIMDVCLFCIQN